MNAVYWDQGTQKNGQKVMHVLKFELNVPNVFVLSIFYYEILVNHLKIVVQSIKLKLNLMKILNSHSLSIQASFNIIHAPSTLPSSMSY